eukprot:TRINITY_DN40656_c0_g1_i4.p1 TRINITY_DN40656_c0_g1~~TRINITY_DN40656_c0_g1_i4.p1  ORF type:complete len:143 (+),score=12.74 TRINITY_DN40656_c0_g1_i4:35-430(+)
MLSTFPTRALIPHKKAIIKTFCCLEQSEKDKARNQLIRKFRISQSMLGKKKTNSQEYKKQLAHKLQEKNAEWRQQKDQTTPEEIARQKQFKQQFKQLKNEVSEWKIQYVRTKGGRQPSSDEIFAEVIQKVN